MSETTELDKTRRYLRPVRATILSDNPDGVHLAVYSWLPIFEAWATGPGLCGESMQQDPLPEGTVVTCTRCEEWRPKYEQMLASGYRPEEDNPDVLRRRAESAEALLKRYVDLVAVTHKYPIAGGHDCLGENHSCAGCALAKQAQEHLEQYG